MNSPPSKNVESRPDIGFYGRLKEDFSLIVALVLFGILVGACGMAAYIISRAKKGSIMNQNMGLSVGIAAVLVSSLSLFVILVRDCLMNHGSSEYEYKIVVDKRDMETLILN